MSKLILDPTCSGRTIWFDKNHPDALYTDIRRESKGYDFMRPNWEINPDMIVDYRKMPFDDRSFKLVVFDPPHLKNISMKSVIGKKYGSLNADTWKEDVLQGFNECMRVLDDYGILVMKWSCSKDNRPNRDIPLKEVLKILPIQPLVGHTSGSKSNTMWMCFMKIPQRVSPSEDLKDE